jgi:cbb3-type cytochrome oxidase subunit 3
MTNDTINALFTLACLGAFQIAAVVVVYRDRKRAEHRRQEVAWLEIKNRMERKMQNDYEPREHRG